MAWLSKAPDFYFEEFPHQDHFRLKRKNQMEWNAAHRPGPAWTETDELQMVNLLHLNWFGEEWNAGELDFPVLDLDKLPVLPLRKKELPPFKIEYETYQEIKLRLLNTVISIKGHPFLVSKIRQKSGSFELALNDGVSPHYSKVNYKDIQDLRSIPPMYLSLNQTGWLCRIPGKVYQQGLNRNNTVLKSIDSGSSLTALDATSLLRNMAKRTNRKWDGTLLSLLNAGELGSIRLSDDIAVHNKKNKTVACYRGRSLGEVHDNDIRVFDEDDLLQEWIDRASKEVGMELRA